MSDLCASLADDSVLALGVAWLARVAVRRCHLKQNNWKRAGECADEALKITPDHAKAKFRKCQAMVGKGQTNQA